jgi:4-hydroxyphenylacetate decarboxylase small subunit
MQTNSNLRHTDCRNYAPLDVAKGICHRTKEIVLADGDHCEHFVATQKCKFCDHYVSVQPYLGNCYAVSNHPVTYPDLITLTCKNFSPSGVRKE